MSGLSLSKHTGSIAAATASARFPPFAEGNLPPANEEAETCSRYVRLVADAEYVHVSIRVRSKLGRRVSQEILVVTSALLESVRGLYQLVPQLASSPSANSASISSRSLTGRGCIRRSKMSSTANNFSTNSSRSARRLLCATLLKYRVRIDPSRNLVGNHVRRQRWPRSRQLAQQ